MGDGGWGLRLWMVVSSCAFAIGGLVSVGEMLVGYGDCRALL